MPIRVLSEIVAAQIAAGEVVERPASVVKELVENALDAGARSVSVEVTGSGRQLIRVSDDGVGIGAAEAALAFARHSTSKLQTVEDLDHIRTLGFRGEALASIAAVSRTTLVTRHRSEAVGITVQVEGGELRFSRSVGAPAGTVVTVENLFFNTPARLKFLKAESTERRHITQLVTRYAMAYPAVRFRLILEGREQFASTGSGDVADVLVETLGLGAFKQMIEVSSPPPLRPDLPPVEVYGFVSAPGLDRADRGQIVLFVNGRAVADQSLTYAVVQAYHDLLPPGRYPLAVLLVTLAPEEVDVNVHPTKAEVRFRAPDAVFSAVQRAVRRALSEQAPAQSGSTDLPGQNIPVWGRADITPPSVSCRPVPPGEGQLGLRLDLADPGRYSQPAAALPGRAEDTAIPAGSGAPLRPRTLPILRVVGQVGATYIVAEGPAGLYLIDQHAAHKRVLYEALAAQHAAGEPLEWIELDMPAPVDLSPQAARLLETMRDGLVELGFDLESFGPYTVRLRAVPALLANEEPGRVVAGLVDELTHENESGDLPLVERLLRRICRMAAFKAGQVLSYDEMAGLIQQLERCEVPRTCPDGHPTLLHISADDLARQFSREARGQT